MATILFQNEDFSSLGLGEYLSPWNQIGLSELMDSEADLMRTFLNLCSDGAEYDEDNVLLVKAADGGILKQVHGPAVFRKDDALILKVGSNEFPISQNKTEFTVGQLVGSISFGEKGYKATITNEKGDTEEIELYPATLDLMPADGSEQEYRVRCHLDANSEPQPSIVKAAMRGGRSIAKYFKEASEGGGGDAIAMKELGEGEFAVVGIESREGKDQQGKARTSWILELDDGRKVWSRGNVEAVLKGGYRMPSNSPVTLQIANIKVKIIGGQERTSLDCALRNRAPRLAGEKPPASTKPPATKPNTKELVGTGVGAPSPAADDDIPF